MHEVDSKTFYYRKDVDEKLHLQSTVSVRFLGAMDQNDNKSIIVSIIIALIVCRSDVKYALILRRAPFTQEEMRKIGATTEIEYCLVMACYLFVLHYSSDSKMRFRELHDKHTEVCNNPFIHTDCKSYHEALQKFNHNSTISPAVRNWCRFIMHKHGVLRAYRKSRNLGESITATINNDKFVVRDDFMYSLLFPSEN